MSPHGETIMAALKVYDDARKHALLPEECRANLPPLYAGEDEPDPVVVVKLFCPYSQATWFLTEFDGEQTAFGWATLDGFTGELGYVDILEVGTLSKTGGKLPLVERDCHWTPCRLSEAKKGIGVTG